MNVEKTKLQGLLVITPRVFADERGFFYESYNEPEFRKAGIGVEWKQDNHARSARGVLRGLHFQKGPGQAKLVRCVGGSVWDIAVDIRPDSPTLGQWFGLELSAENKKSLFVPLGFAHGYVVISESADFLYKCSTTYDAALEDEIRFDDPELGIDWPVKSPILSPRDAKAQSFAEYLRKQRELCPQSTPSSVKSTLA